MAFRSEERICYEFDDFLVDPNRRVLLRGDVPVPISPKVLAILVVLLAQPGEVVEKSDLIEKVWAGAHVSDANLTQNVFALRKILGEKANESHYVVTVPGRGYSFVGEVRRIERAPTGVFPLVAGLALPPPVPEPVTEKPPADTETPSLPVAVSRAPTSYIDASRRSRVMRSAALLGLSLLGALLLG